MILTEGFCLDSWENPLSNLGLWDQCPGQGVLTVAGPTFRLGKYDDEV